MTTHLTSIPRVERRPRDFDDFGDHTPLLSHMHFRTQVVLDPILTSDPDSVRSWIGGRPEMPADINWPRIAGRTAQFVAQIDCSDLPRDLWGGVGPRTGWLAIFIDSSNEGVRVLHLPERGPTRHEPLDLEGGRTAWMIYPDRHDGSNKPYFPKLPVQPSIATPRAAAHGWGKPILPLTVGQLRTCAALAFHGYQVLLDQDPDEIAAMRAKRGDVHEPRVAALFRERAALDRSVLRQIVEHNRTVAGRIDEALSSYAALDPGAFLPEGAWAEFSDLLQTQSIARARSFDARDEPPDARWIDWPDQPVPYIEGAKMENVPVPDYLSPNGIVPDGVAWRHWIDIVGSYLSCLETGSLPDAAQEHLAGHLGPEPDAGNLMGGITPWRHWPNPGVMNLEHYLSATGRTKYIEDSYVQPVIFGEPDILLLHLRSDSRIGSYWGDMYSLEVFVPREDFAAGVFERAHHRITNG